MTTKDAIRARIFHWLRSSHLVPIFYPSFTHLVPTFICYELSSKSMAQNWQSYWRPELASVTIEQRHKCSSWRNL